MQSGVITRHLLGSNLNRITSLTQNHTTSCKAVDALTAPQRATDISFMGFRIKSENILFTYLQRPFLWHSQQPVLSETKKPNYILCKQQFKMPSQFFFSLNCFAFYVITTWYKTAAEYIQAEYVHPGLYVLLVHMTRKFMREIFSIAY